MKLLRDDEIEAFVRNPTAPILTNFVVPKNWHDKESLVQPSSLDLHVGDILVPGVSSGKRGSVQKPHENHVLQTGETVVVVTRETLSLPANLAGFGFPPTRISNKAVLMTSPGHIDPGYSGSLRFTLINMGREPYEIRRDDVLVTILLVQLSSNSAYDYGKRNPKVHTTASLEDDLDRLANDFLNVSERAQRIADQAVLKAGFVSALLVGFFAVLAQIIQPGWRDPLNELKARVDVLSSERSASALATRLQRMEKVFCDTQTDTQRARLAKAGVCH